MQYHLIAHNTVQCHSILIGIVVLISIPCFAFCVIECYHIVLQSLRKHFTSPLPRMFHFCYMLMHAIWGCIWKYTVEQILIIEANVTLILFMQAIWKFAYKCSAVQKRQTKSMNVYIAIDFTLLDLFQVDFYYYSSATTENMLPLKQYIWENVWKYTSKQHSRKKVGSWDPGSKSVFGPN